MSGFMPVSGLSPKRRVLLNLFRERGFAFVHVPKTAGFAMTSLLLDGVASEHARAIELRAQLGRTTWRSLFTFGFSRDPGQRFLSAFWYLASGGMNERDAAWSSRHLSAFPSAEAMLIAARNGNTELLEWTHFRPQVWFLCGDDRELLVNYVGRYEHLELHFRDIQTRIGIGPYRLPELNRTVKLPERLDHWSDESRQLLFDTYIDDYSVLGYPAPR